MVGSTPSLGGGGFSSGLHAYGMGQRFAAVSKEGSEEHVPSG